MDDGDRRDDEWIEYHGGYVDGGVLNKQNKNWGAMFSKHCPATR